jgi:hypothetical protein
LKITIETLEEELKVEKARLNEKSENHNKVLA